MVRRPRSERAPGRTSRRPSSGRREVVRGAGRRRVQGRFTGRPAGDAWVLPTDSLSGDEEDVHVTRSRIRDALPGDLVEVEVLFRSRRGRLEGEVRRVMDPGADRVVGQFTDFGTVVVWDPQWSREIPIRPGSAARARPGDLVGLRVRRPSSLGRPVLGDIETVFGPSGDPGAELAAAMARFRIREGFSQPALDQAAAAPSSVGADERGGREDLRGRVIVTMDPSDARDHDDAVEAAPLSAGGFRIGVHIADVSHYVPAGSPVDREAALRGTSVYFPERVVPMLPEALSSGICSLVAGQDRLTRSVEIEIGPDGLPRRVRCFRAVIRSAARLSYSEGAALLEGSGGGLVGDAVRNMGRAAGGLAAARRRRGAVDLDLPEPRLRCGARGRLLEAGYAERSAAHRLVEDFMLLANQSVAERLRSTGARALHRVHPAPSESRVRVFEDLLGRFGERLRAASEPLRPAHFARLGERIRSRPEARFLRRRMLRAMRPAEYSPRGVGHFALALPDYAHFTSPIRRYPDLVVHRALDGVAGGSRPAGPPEAAAELEALARRCSERERAAEAAERAVVERRVADLLRGRLGDVFPARVAETHRSGLVVELDEIPARGAAPLALLSREPFRFDRRDFSLRSRRSGRTFRIGDALEVQLVRVDPLRGALEFRLP